MDPDDAAQRARIRETILRYIRRHPGAADTASGIVASWLPARGFESAPDHIHAVLDELVDAGLLRRYTLPDGNVLYARAKP